MERKIEIETIATDAFIRNHRKSLSGATIVTPKLLLPALAGDFSRETEKTEEFSIKSLDGSPPAINNGHQEQNKIKNCAECGGVGLRPSENTCPICRLAGMLKSLMSTGKISADLYENLRLIFALPKEIKKLSPKQARAVCRILEVFPGKFSAAQQAELSTFELAVAVAEVPVLPKLFTGRLAGIINRQKGSADCAPPKTPVKRKPVSAEKFREVAARQGSFCFWCGIKVIRESDIPKTNRIVKNAETVVYLTKSGELREEAIATIDHLIRVADGGGNDPENMVVSCVACNQERGRRTIAHGRMIDRRRFVCRICGGSFFHSEWNCCSICGAAKADKLTWFAIVRLVLKKLGLAIESKLIN